MRGEKIKGTLWPKNRVHLKTQPTLKTDTGFMTSITRQMDLAYSFGGTRDAPLVRGVVPFTYDTHVHSCVQEAFLERTEIFLTLLTMTFDNALRTFDDGHESRAARLKALDVMVSTVVFTTRSILTQSPGVHYALMFTRIQEVFKRAATIQTLFGDEVLQGTEEILKPAWVDLRAIDQSFGNPVEGEGIFVPSSEQAQSGLDVPLQTATSDTFDVYTDTETDIDEEEDEDEDEEEDEGSEFEQEYEGEEDEK